MRFLFLILLLAFRGFSQDDQLTARVLTPAGQIGRFNKLEIGVTLPQEIAVKVENFLKEKRVPASRRINPFLEWEVDVQAVFTHVASGEVKLVDGFYYREYERDPQSNSWKEKDQGNETMRIRFAPPWEGEWECRIVLNVGNTFTPYACALRFDVAKSQNPGYVSVHPNGKNLQLGGKIIYPVGGNFPSPIKKVDVYHTSANGPLFGPKETHRVTKLSHWLEYHDDIRQYSEQGGRFIRTLQTGWSSLLEFEKKGNYYDRQPYAWEQDRLLEFCEQNGVYIHFNLMQQEPFMKYGNYDMFDWDFSQYRRDGSFEENPQYPSYAYSGNGKREAYEMFLNENDLRFHEQRTRYYISRYGYSTAIYLFELLSEPFHLNQIGGREEPYLQATPEGDSVRLAIETYHTRMAGFIKRTMRHQEHLVGINMLNLTLLMYEQYQDKSMYCADIDVIGINPYSEFVDKLIISKSTPNNFLDDSENTMYRAVNSIHERAKKPLIVSEGGAGDFVDACSDYKPEQKDMATFGFCGFAAFNSWKAWDEKDRKNWPQLIRSQDFMGSDSVVNVLAQSGGQWTQGRQAEKIRRSDDKKSKELQYYVSARGDKATGYVANRTANYFTLRQSDQCFSKELEKTVPWNALTNISWKDGKPLFVSGLSRRKSYTVTWYSATTGKVVLTECQRLSGRKFVLRFPELTVETGSEYNPVYWFVIGESGCR